jgi:hypothetical protein
MNRMTQSLLVLDLLQKISKKQTYRWENKCQDRHIDIGLFGEPMGKQPDEWMKTLMETWKTWKKGQVGKMDVRMV